MAPHRTLSMLFALGALTSCAPRSANGSGKDAGLVLTSCKANGDTMTVSVARDATPLGGFAQDEGVFGGHLYVAVITGNDSYEILSVPLPCGAPTTLVTRTGDAEATGAMVGPVLDQGVLYWIDGAGLTSMPASGGKVRTLVASRPAALPEPRGVSSYSPKLAVHGGYVYWADVDGTVSRVAVAGGAQETLASGYGHPGAIAVDGNYVYWASHEDLSGRCRDMDGGDCAPLATILKMPLAGGAPSTLATEQHGTFSILPTQSGIYWANFGGFGIDAPLQDGEVMRLPAAGGPPVAVSTTMMAPDSLQTAGGSVYWLAHGAQGWASITGERGRKAFADDFTPHRISAFAATERQFYWVEFVDTLLTAVYSSPRPR